MINKTVNIILGICTFLGAIAYFRQYPIKKDFDMNFNQIVIVIGLISFLTLIIVWIKTLYDKIKQREYAINRILHNHSQHILAIEKCCKYEISFKDLPTEDKIIDVSELLFVRGVSNPNKRP